MAWLAKIIIKNGITFCDYAKKVGLPKYEYCKEQNFGVNFRAKSYARNQDDIKKIHNAGLVASCWTVDTPELLNSMLEAGVEYITTNCIYRKPVE